MSEQWALEAPWLTERAWTGRPRTLDLREVSPIEGGLVLFAAAVEALTEVEKDLRVMG